MSSHHVEKCMVAAPCCVICESLAFSHFDKKAVGDKRRINPSEELSLFLRCLNPNKAVAQG
jgi:hypothetical protein